VGKYCTAVHATDNNMAQRPRSHVPVFDRPAGSDYRRTQ